MIEKTAALIKQLDVKLDGWRDIFNNHSFCYLSPQDLRHRAEYGAIVRGSELDSLRRTGPFSYLLPYDHNEKLRQGVVHQHLHRYGSTKTDILRFATRLG